MDTSKIDVRKTLEQGDFMDNPYVIYLVLRAMDEEEQGIPIEEPPSEEGFKRLLWMMRGSESLGHPFYPKQMFPTEMLVPFVKLPQDRQKKILYRAMALNLKFFGGRKFKLMTDI